MRRLTLCALALTVVLAAGAARADNFVTTDCDAISSWYQCRDIKDAPLLAQDGHEIIYNTPVTLGPWGDYKGADGGPIIYGTLSCTSCHFDGGQVPGGMPFFQVRDKYAPPGQYWRGGNHKREITERINWCLVSCANGQFLPENSYPMQAMIAYMDWIAEGITDISMLGADNWKNIPGKDLPLLNPNALSMKADAAAGQTVYQQRCDKCHGIQGPGQGRYEPYEPRARVPALWGSRSFTKGAQGMYTAPLLAYTIKKFMPIGKAGSLTDQQALDVAGYIVSQKRDMGFATETFFGGSDPATGVPNYYFKPSYFPIGVPIPNDPFSFTQRLLGPWKPIEDWQAQQRALWLTGAIQ